MSEILLDRIRLYANGSFSLVVRIRPSDGAPPPSSATVRLVARESDEDLAVPADLTDEGEGQWAATFVLSSDAFGGVPADVAILDCIVDVTIHGDVLSSRLGWDEGGTRWLPYPTAGRKLSLTRVAP